MQVQNSSSAIVATKNATVVAWMGLPTMADNWA